MRCSVVSLTKSIWIAIIIAAILLTAVGGIAPADSWRFDIQLPGSAVALLLLWVLGPLAMTLGASGGIFIGAVTILTNVAVYAGFVALTLLVRRMFRKEA